MSMTAAEILVRIGADTTGLTSGLKSADSKLSSFNQKAGAAVGRNISRGFKLGAAGMVAFGAVSVKLATDFDTTMRTMGAVAGVPQDELAQLGALAEKMGADTVFSANEAAEAMLELSKAGVSTADIMGGALKETLSLAAAGDIGLAEAATTAANSMSVFGLKGSEAKQAADALAGAANASSADVNDLTMALAQAGTGADSAGFSIQETTAALAAFADKGIRGSDAGTSFKTMMIGLAPTSEAAQGKMDELGLSFVDAHGNFDDLTTVAGKLQGALGEVGEAERVTALKTMFGTDAFRAANVMTKEGAEGMQVYLDATSKVGTAQEVADARMAGFAGTMEKLKGSFETVALKVGQALMPMLDKFAKWLTEKAPAIGKFAVGVVKFVGGVIGAFGKLQEFMKVVGGEIYMWIYLPISKVVKFVTGAVGRVAGFFNAAFVKPIGAVIKFVGGLIAKLKEALDWLNAVSRANASADAADSREIGLLKRVAASGGSQAQDAKDRLSELGVDGFSSGGIITSSGLAIVHKGETVTPATGSHGDPRTMGGLQEIVLDLGSGLRLTGHMRQIAAGEAASQSRSDNASAAIR